MEHTVAILTEIVDGLYADLRAINTRIWQGTLEESRLAAAESIEIETRLTAAVAELLDAMHLADRLHGIAEDADTSAAIAASVLLTGADARTLAQYSHMHRAELARIVRAEVYGPQWG